MKTRTYPVPTESERGRAESGKAALDRRLDDIGWGLLFILAGAVWLTPDAMVPWGVWVIGFGLLLLALNLVRYLSGIAPHTFSTGLGVLALAAGVGDLADIDIPLMGLALVAIGGAIVYRTWRRPAEQG